jgi:hypothetical protein
MDGMLIMLRSMDNEKASEILCRKFKKYCAEALVKSLPGPPIDAVRRATIFLSVISSFQAMLRVDEQMELTEDDPGILAERLHRLFGMLAI